MKLIEMTRERDERKEPADGPPAKEIFASHEALIAGLIEAYSQSHAVVTGAGVDKPKISVADLIRLIQFHREIAAERPFDVVEVRWIDPKQEI